MRQEPRGGQRMSAKSEKILVYAGFGQLQHLAHANQQQRLQPGARPCSAAGAALCNVNQGIAVHTALGVARQFIHNHGPQHAQELFTPCGAPTIFQ